VRRAPRASNATFLTGISPTHSPMFKLQALRPSRGQARRSDVVKDELRGPLLECFNPVRLAIGVPRTDRRRIDRMRIGGYSDSACDNDNWVSRRWVTYALRSTAPQPPHQDGLRTTSAWMGFSWGQSNLCICPEVKEENMWRTFPASALCPTWAAHNLHEA